MKKPRRGGKKSSGDKKEPSLSLIKIFWCFPLLVLAVYLSPRYPFPSFVPERLRHCCRLWGIYKEGCWQIKVTGRDGGVLNIRSTSHRSRPSPTDSRGYIQQQTIKKKKKRRTHANVLEREARWCSYKYTYGVVTGRPRMDGIWPADAKKGQKGYN